MLMLQCFLSILWLIDYDIKYWQEEVEQAQERLRQREEEVEEERRFQLSIAKDKDMIKCDDLILDVDIATDSLLLHILLMNISFVL